MEVGMTRAWPKRAGPPIRSARKVGPTTTSLTILSLSSSASSEETISMSDLTESRHFGIPKSIPTRNSESR